MYNQIPYMLPISNAAGAATGATSFLGKINWASLLSNAQKTLNVVNQAVPLYYQVKPVFKNLRAMKKIGKEFSKIENGNNQNNASTNISTQNQINNNVNTFEEEIPEPRFFL